MPFPSGVWVSVAKSADSLMGVPLYVICHFSFVAFNMLSVFNFCQFDYYVSWCVHPWVYLSLDSLCFLDLVDYFLSHAQEVFSYYLFKYFLRSSLSLSSPPGTPIMWMLVLLMLPQGSLRQSAFLLILFLYPVLGLWFTPSCPSGHSSILPQLLCYPSLLVYYSSLSVGPLFSSSRSW